MNQRLLLASCVLVAACGTADPVDNPVQQTGASLNVDYFGDTDVVGFHFEVTRVACDAYDVFTPNTIEGNVDLVDGIFPGQIELVEQILDPESRHLASDFFVTLEPGCYDVLAVPASEIDGDDWTASSDCASTSTEDLVVEAGLTTEATLLSQCLGDPIGALDVLVVLNHPPEFDLEIDEKFAYECEPVHVCATVIDVDDDPIEVTWENLNQDTDLFDLEVHDPVVVGFEGGHRIWEACATLVPQLTDSYDILVQVYDLAVDGTHIEDLVAPEESHAELIFPIHSNWIEEPMCIDDEGEAVPADGVSIIRAKGCTWTSEQSYYCDQNKVPELYDYLCDDDGNLILEALYPECD